jgi:hypothetical protein
MYQEKSGNLGLQFHKIGITSWIPPAIEILSLGQQFQLSNVISETAFLL